MTGQAPRRHAARVARALFALIVLVAVVGGVPMLLASVHMVPHRIPSLHELGRDLRQRDTGQLAAVVLAAGVWVCWALFTLSLIPEIAAVARKRPARLLPGLGAFQHPAGALVSAIALGFTIAPMVAGVGASQAHAAPASAATMASNVSPRSLASGPASSADSATGAANTPTKANEQGPTYEVRRHDTLWKIAEDHLGDPLRYPEIIALNPGAIGPDNEIVSGEILRLPADATGLPAQDATAPGSTRDVQVEPGDTLWGIEERMTGSGANWSAGWEVNKGRAEPGRERFTDPNLIKPGWTLSIPTRPSDSTSPSRAHRPAAAQPSARPSQRPQPGDPPSGSATPGTAPASRTTPSRTPVSNREELSDSPVRASSGNRYQSLLVGGGLLAAVGAATLMTHRRWKFRRRRLGHVVASLPETLMPLEQALFSAGRPALAKMVFLDLALRDLATLVAEDPGGALPDVVAASINDEFLELYLSADADAPPRPWLAPEPTRWTLSRNTTFDTAAEQRVAPYPCLVSIGYTADGTEYLLDLENPGALQLRGDPDRCVDLARYMAAELANNVWSDHLTVTMAGFAEELVAANPTRVAYTADTRNAAQTLARVANENREVSREAGVDVLEGRLRGTAGDVWMPQVLLATPAVLDDDADLFNAIGRDKRLAVAVVLAGVRDDLQAAAQQVITVTDHGGLRTPLIPVEDLIAFGLPADDAAEMAQAIALDRDGTVDEPTPAAPGTRAWDRFSDAAGALLPDYTVPRTPSGPTSIDLHGAATSCALPGPDGAYLNAAATTAEDLAALAPSVTAETRSAVEQAFGDDLDELVAAWFDDTAQVAKLQDLGPVTVIAYGRPPAKQLDFCIEIVVYLSRHPNGVSTNKFANDLFPHRNYVGTDSYPKDMVSRVRSWLGVDQRTDTDYIPRAGRDGYRMQGVLVASELFRALRARGEARGADGLADLITALELVSGPPLSKLREHGYEWLPVGEDLMYTGAVVEVAHLLATSALKAGNSAAAVKACEVALMLDAEDDRALLDLAKAHENAGRQGERDATILRLKTLEDLPERTVEVMRRNGWLARGA